MNNLAVALKTIRPPVSPVVNEDTFDEAQDACPALKSIVADGYKDKEFDSGLATTLSLVYDALEGSGTGSTGLNTLTMEVVSAFDKLLGEDNGMMGNLVDEFPDLKRLMNNKKPSIQFKAGVVLAYAALGLETAVAPKTKAIKGVPVAEDPSPEPMAKPSKARRKVDLADLLTVLNQSGIDVSSFQIVPIVGSDGSIRVEIQGETGDTIQFQEVAKTNAVFKTLTGEDLTFFSESPIRFKFTV